MDCPNCKTEAEFHHTFTPVSPYGGDERLFPDDHEWCWLCTNCEWTQDVDPYETGMPENVEVHTNEY